MKVAIAELKKGNIKGVTELVTPQNLIRSKQRNRVNHLFLLDL